MYVERLFDIKVNMLLISYKGNISTKNWFEDLYDHSDCDLKDGGEYEFEDFGDLKNVCGS